jgi:hypothetical protein
MAQMAQMALGSGIVVLALADGVELRHGLGWLGWLLVSREATCAISASYHGNSPNLDVHLEGLPLGVLAESSQREVSLDRLASHEDSPHFT